MGMSLVICTNCPISFLLNSNSSLSNICSRWMQVLLDASVACRNKKFYLDASSILIYNVAGCTCNLYMTLSHLDIALQVEDTSSFQGKSWLKFH